MESWTQKTLEPCILQEDEDNLPMKISLINNTSNNGVMAAGLSQMVSEDLLSHWYLYILLSTVWWFSFNLSVPSFCISATSCGSTKWCLYLLVRYRKFFLYMYVFSKKESISHHDSMNLHITNLFLYKQLLEKLIPFARNCLDDA